jgi:hypothetical protein
MSNETNIEATLDDIYYGMDEKDIICVQAHTKNGYVYLYRDGTVVTDSGLTGLSKDQMKKLLIAWLALECPEILKNDDKN